MLVLAKAIVEKMSPVRKSSSNDVGFHLQMALAIIFVVNNAPHTGQSSVRQGSLVVLIG
jgi:hypothetical protein